ncbi:MAG: peptidoglycan-binding protein [Gallionellales bacterium RIFOXYB12_FULL_54_9]|nr:MAG: peptidoglycan-binding protein [Gallionellales bacterium RIFOXYB12_FULL_54_9]
MRKIISLICFLLPIMGFAGQPANTLQIRDDAPDQYTVVKGDTLWDISGKFFKDPWRWPYIWGMNKNDIKDPHWIYPGATIVLDRSNGSLRMGGSANNSEVIKLSPRIRSQDSTENAIPSIPSKAIEPFLSQPLVVAEEALAHAPTLIGVAEERVIIGTGDTAYAKGLTESQGKKWQVYRPGKTFVDPDSHELLGYEAIFLGSVHVKAFSDVSTVVITSAKQEINPGDRLLVPETVAAQNYLPRAPDFDINTRVISIYGGVSQAGQNTVITLNKGKRDGLQAGHILALTSKGRVLQNEGKKLALPDEHYGLAFVFRVFDKVSYALIMQSRLPVQLLDHAITP